MSDDIIVTTIDAANIELDIDPSIANELNDFFTFFAHNYMFMPKFKNGLWDGKVHLYRYISSTLPAGLFDLLCQFADEREYNIVDNRDVVYTGNNTDEDVDKFLDQLRVRSDFEKIEFRDYQKEAVKNIVLNKRATIVSSTSSGKSLIIYGLIRYFIKFLANKVLLITPTVNLVEQMYSDFEDYSTKNGWDAKNNVHKIYDYDGMTKDSEAQIYISTWQSIHRQPKSYFQKFGLVIFDEVHLATAESVVSIMEKTSNAHIRAGFTGTLKNEHLHKLKLTGIFGPIVKVTTTRDLMDAGYISKLHMKILVLKYNDGICHEINRKVVEYEQDDVKIFRNNYINEMDYITSLQERNEFLSNLACATNGNVLILFSKIEKHGKPLYELIKKRLDKSRKIYYTSGETKATEREEIRKLIDNGKNSVWVASYGTVSTGVNVKNINYVILASPYKSEVKVLQSIGRALRISGTKDKAVVFDIVDDMAYGSKMNYCYKHFMKRLDIYRKERFPMSVSKYNLI